MKVKDIDLRFDIGKEIKIVKINNPDFKYVQGKCGTITHPFGEFELTDIGVFLDVPFNNCDTLNLTEQDEVEFLEEN